MNQYGILSFYLPAWRRIVGQMQHDLFHVTVDQHIMQVLRNVVPPDGRRTPNEYIR